jgi:hypothetical protein
LKELDSNQTQNNRKRKINELSYQVVYKRTFDSGKLETIKLFQAFVGGTALKVPYPVFAGSGERCRRA